MVLNLHANLPQDIRQCLEIHLTVTMWGRGRRAATGIEWVEVTEHRTEPGSKKMVQPKMSVVQKLRNPGIDYK